MNSDAEMMERHGRLLARFAEQAASLAEDLHACALEAETVEEKQAISIAFHRMGRALRQSVALEAKLRRDLARAQREDRVEADGDAGARRAAARAKAKATLTRLIHEQAAERHGGWQVDAFRRESLERLERLLAEDEAHGLIPDDVAGYIARLARQFGIVLEEDEDEAGEDDAGDRDEDDGPGFRASG
jgi:hypothetical protein